MDVPEPRTVIFSGTLDMLGKSESLVKLRPMGKRKPRYGRILAVACEAACAATAWFTSR